MLFGGPNRLLQRGIVHTYITSYTHVIYTHVHVYVCVCIYCIYIYKYLHIYICLQVWALNSYCRKCCFYIVSRFGLWEAPVGIACAVLESWAAGLRQIRVSYDRKRHYDEGFI